MKRSSCPSPGVIVISVIDNLIYPILVEDKMRVHTLVIFFSLVNGLFLSGSSGLVPGQVAVVSSFTVWILERSRIRAG